MGKTAVNKDSKKNNDDQEAANAANAAALAEELGEAVAAAAAAVAEEAAAAADSGGPVPLFAAVKEVHDQAAQQQYILLLSDVGFRFAELFCNYDLKMQTARFAHEERMTELEIEAKQTGLVSKSQILKEFHEAGISVEVQAQADLRL